MFGKKLALAAVLVATATGFAGAADLPVKAKAMKAAPEVPFFFVNLNWLSFEYRFAGTDPGFGNTAKKIINFTHFDVWAYGTNFLTIDALNSDSNDPPTGSTGTGETEIYGLIRSTFGWNQIFNTKMFSIGPMTNISFIVGGDANTANGGTLPAKKDLVAGLDFGFALPYKGRLDIAPMFYKEWNHNQFVVPLPPSGNTEFDPTWAVEITYEVPLGFLPPSIPLVFSGYSNFYGPKGNGSPGQPNTALQFLSEQRLTLDVGRMMGQRPGFYSVYGGYRYWRNKFGIDSSNPANIGLYPGVIESTFITGATVAF